MRNNEEEIENWQRRIRRWMDLLVTNERSISFMYDPSGKESEGMVDSEFRLKENNFFWA